MSKPIDLSKPPKVRGFKPEVIDTVNKAFAADPEGFIEGLMKLHAAVDAAQPKFRPWKAEH